MNDLLATFSKNLVDLRNQLGWNRSELHRRINDAGHLMHMTTLRRLEKEQMMPRLDDLLVLSEVFGVPIDRLVKSEAVSPSDERERLFRAESKLNAIQQILGKTGHEA